MPSVSHRELSKSQTRRPCKNQLKHQAATSDYVKKTLNTNENAPHIHNRKLPTTNKQPLNSAHE